MFISISSTSIQTIQTFIIIERSPLLWSIFIPIIFILYFYFFSEQIWKNRKIMLIKIFKRIAFFYSLVFFIAFSVFLLYNIILNYTDFYLFNSLTLLDFISYTRTSLMIFYIFKYIKTIIYQGFNKDNFLIFIFGLSIINLITILIKIFITTFIPEIYIVLSLDGTPNTGNSYGPQGSQPPQWHQGPQGPQPPQGPEPPQGPNHAQPSHMSEVTEEQQEELDEIKDFEEEYEESGNTAAQLTAESDNAAEDVIRITENLYSKEAELQEKQARGENTEQTLNEIRHLNESLNEANSKEETLFVEAERASRYHERVGTLYKNKYDAYCNKYGNNPNNNNNNN
uniref:Uncharacterized protein n=1 Tax=Niveomyces insectorum TaxID=150359 RepID=A0A6B9DDY3_9HYPO|nr:hypothetical protein [Niveomyces insectorum]